MMITIGNFLFHQKQTVKHTMKRNPGLCFVNSYDTVLLKTWEANLDIQPVHNYYKTLIYMAAYFSKSKSESGAAKVISGSLF